MQAWGVMTAGKPLQELDLPTPRTQRTQVMAEVAHRGVRHSGAHFPEGFLHLGGPEKTPISTMAGLGSDAAGMGVQDAGG